MAGIVARMAFAPTLSAATVHHCEVRLCLPPPDGGHVLSFVSSLFLPVFLRPKSVAISVRATIYLSVHRRGDVQQRELSLLNRVE